MSSAHPFTLKRKNSLKLNSDIQKVFSSENVIRTGIINVFYTFDIFEDSEIKVLFSVPKKLFRKSYQRNFLKRRMREALRLNSTKIREKNLASNLCLKMAIVYSSSIIHDYKKIEEKIIISLQKIYDQQY